MVKIIGKAPLTSYSQNLVLPYAVSVQDLPGLLKMPDDLAEVIIVVRDHQKLDFDELIENDDEIYLFMAVMGG